MFGLLTPRKSRRFLACTTLMYNSLDTPQIAPIPGVSGRPVEENSCALQILTVFQHCSNLLRTSVSTAAFPGRPDRTTHLSWCQHLRRCGGGATYTRPTIAEPGPPLHGLHLARVAVQLGAQLETHKRTPSLRWGPSHTSRPRAGEIVDLARFHRNGWSRAARKATVRVFRRLRPALPCSQRSVLVITRAGIHRCRIPWRL